MTSDGDAVDQPRRNDTGPATPDRPGDGALPEAVERVPAPADVVPSTPGPPAPPAGTAAARPAGPVPRTRLGGLWVAAIAATLVLLFLLIFILQNGQRVKVAFLGFDGHLPLGVALLLAAACGVLLVAIPGTGRILQLRRRARRSARAAPPAAPEPKDR
jgi:uncharacterized integral membrane protein